MADITTLPEAELQTDLAETRADLAVCELALAVGVTTYHGGESVAARADVNRRIAAVIEAELARRVASPADTVCNERCGGGSVSRGRDST